jgi:hypothetical protein
MVSHYSKDIGLVTSLKKTTLYRANGNPRLIATQPHIVGLAFCLKQTSKLGYQIILTRRHIVDMVTSIATTVTRVSHSLNHNKHILFQAKLRNPAIMQTVAGAALSSMLTDIIASLLSAVYSQSYLFTYLN